MHLLCRTLPLLLWIAPVPAFAQTFDAVLVAQKSLAQIDLDTRLEASGFLIGDYDADIHPQGTQTRPGLFGGSGNNPIPSALDLETVASGSTMPAGAFVLAADFDALLGTLDALALDLLDGETVPAMATATLLFDSFNTIQPTSIYPGGVPVEVPLGEVGAIIAADVLQTAPASVLLVTTADPDILDFSTTIPAVLHLVVRVAPPDAEPTDLPLDPLPMDFLASGSVERQDSGNLLLNVAIEPFESSGTTELDGEPLPPIPLELPTLGSETASVVLHLGADSLDYTVLLAVDLHALAVPTGPTSTVFANGFETLPESPDLSRATKADERCRPDAARDRACRP